MKKRIAEYVAPDLSELNKKMEITMQNSEKSVQYTQDIKNDLKADIRRLEGVVDNVERSAKQSQRETDQDIRALRQNSERDLKELKREVDSKIQKALDNPLAGK
jgi:archaellum component FlaC